jgi:hypothetical protein
VSTKAWMPEPWRCMGFVLIWSYNL